MPSLVLMPHTYSAAKKLNLLSWPPLPMPSFRMRWQSISTCAIPEVSRPKNAHQKNARRLALVCLCHKSRTKELLLAAPLESALTKFRKLTLLKSALPKQRSLSGIVYLTQNKARRTLSDLRKECAACSQTQMISDISGIS